MKIISPFNTLGLDIAALKDLSLPDLAKVVSSQYLIMQKIHHPDHGGDPEKSKRLNEARDELKSPRALKEWRNETLKAAGNKRLKQSLENATRALKFQLNFILQFYILLWRRSQGGHYVDLMGLGEEEILLRHIPPTSINMFAYTRFADHVNKAVDNEADRQEIKKTAKQRAIDRSFTQLRIVNGRLWEMDFRQTATDISHRLLVGVITEDTILNFCHSQEPLPNFLARVCQPEKVKDAVQQLSANLPLSTRPPYTYSLHQTGKKVIANISWQNFLRLLPFLTTEPAIGSHLLSMKVPVAGQEIGLPTFQVEGQIAKEKPKIN